jgi:hypothetical protein
MDTIGWSALLSILISSIIGTAVSLVASIIRIQRYEREREITERNLIIHKLQFETEYQLYLDLWEALKIAAGYVLAVVHKPGDERPIFGQPELVQKKLRNAHEILYHKAPFFPPQVYKHAILTSNKIEARLSEGIEYISRNEIWEENEHNYKEMNDCFDLLASDIRKRVMGKDWNPEPVTPIKILDQIKLEIENQIEKQNEHE